MEYLYIMENYIGLDSQNIENEHICCAFSDKKCSYGYKMKKQWLLNEFSNGYRFVRLDARAKVFIEYGPAENGWMPIIAPNYFLLGCFWVSGQYKGNGHAKALLQHAIDDAKSQQKQGLAVVVGKSKLPFLGDGKWLMHQGFEVCDSLSSGFNLLTLNFSNQSIIPRFGSSAAIGKPVSDIGLVVYYSNRCPFTEYYVNSSLKEAAQKRGVPLTIIKIETKMEAQAAPSPATIFSLYYNGKLITTDLSVCLDSKFDKFIPRL